MRASEYPIPDYACYVWSRGDCLMVSLPDYSGTSNGRTLAIPYEKLANDAGMPAGFRALWDLLNARRNDLLAGKRPQIGTASEPTHEMLRLSMLANAGRSQSHVKRSTNVDIFETTPEETDNAPS